MANRRTISRRHSHLPYRKENPTAVVKQGTNPHTIDKRKIFLEMNEQLIMHNHMHKREMMASQSQSTIDQHKKQKRKTHTLYGPEFAVTLPKELRLRI